MTSTGCQNPWGRYHVRPRRTTIASLVALLNRHAIARLEYTHLGRPEVRRAFVHDSFAFRRQSRQPGADMARALKVRLIAINKEINAEKFRIEDQQSEIKQQITELESQNAELDEKHSSLMAQINRAKEYSRTHAPEVILTCVRCFVVQGVLQNMLRTKAKVAGIRRYRCKRCGEEMNGDEPGVSA